MNPLQGLLLALTLMSAANAQEAITGHDINDAIYLEQMLNEYDLFSADTWECEDDETPPNCTLRGKARTPPTVFLDPVMNIAPNIYKPPTAPADPDSDPDNKEMTHDEIINECTALLRAGLFLGTVVIPPARLAQAARAAGIYVQWAAGKVAPKVVEVIKVSYNNATRAFELKFNIAFTDVIKGNIVKGAGGATFFYLIEKQDVPEAFCELLIASPIK